MSDILRLIHETDLASIEMERAKDAVEAAKAALEVAKEKYEGARSQYEQTVAQADEIGIPRAKLKKLIEERTNSLMSSGLLGTAGDEKSKAPRSAKAPKKSKTNADKLGAQNSEETSIEFDTDSASHTGTESGTESGTDIDSHDQYQDEALSEMSLAN